MQATYPKVLKVFYPMVLLNYRLLAVFLLSLVLTACSSDDDGYNGGDSEYSISDIQGNWEATEFYFEELVSSGTGEFIDLISLGISGEMEILSDGRFAIVQIAPGGTVVETITGDLYIDGNFLAVTFDTDPGEEEYFDFDLYNNGSTLAMWGPAEFDFNGDGTDEPASVNIVWERF